jgi:hypothetical protein
VEFRWQYQTKTRLLMSIPKARIKVWAETRLS